MTSLLFSIQSLPCQPIEIKRFFSDCHLIVATRFIASVDEQLDQCSQLCRRILQATLQLQNCQGRTRKHYVILHNMHHAYSILIKPAIDNSLIILSYLKQFELALTKL